MPIRECLDAGIETNVINEFRTSKNIKGDLGYLHNPSRDDGAPPCTNLGRWPKNSPVPPSVPLVKARVLHILAKTSAHVHPCTGQGSGFGLGRGFCAWEDKWTKKYGGDLKVNHDRIFNQLSLKSYPGSGELANWKEMIHEKNRSLLIAPVDIESEAIESENDSADAAVLHGAAAEAERREAGEGTDISESIGGSGAEGTPKAITKALKRKKVVMAKDPDPAPLPTTTRPILTRKSKRAKITIPPKSGVSSAPVPEAGRKKQQSSSELLFFYIKLLPFSFI
ncbi:uncharacterized protein LOC126602786 [Malus sylvestris]|uniref:uncharacterized protein LOC126602786 n=1 Tax=Malus sylvestris TaxID=3752 RepID=UPI0021AC39C7|nr:uncharacterized protein LOC126602786 [Malus sylvestris]